MHSSVQAAVRHHRLQADLWGSIPGLVNTPQLPVWRRSTQDGACTSNDRPQRLAFKRLRSFDDCSSRAGYSRTLEETSAGFYLSALISDFRIASLPASTAASMSLRTSENLCFARSKDSGN